MAFRLVKDSMDTHTENLEISSVAVAVGDLLELNPGSAESWVLATSSSEFWTPKAVATASAVSGDTEVKAVIVTPYQLWEADVTNNGASAHDNQLMVLTDEATVNNTGTNSTANSAIFRQKNFTGAAADNTVVGYLAVGHGLDVPAAA